MTQSDEYDAGILNDFGGGDIAWWQDYIRAELGRSHDFYQAEITRLRAALDERLVASVKPLVWEPCDELVAAAYLDAAQVLEDEIDLARIALPQAVPVLGADIRAIKNRTPTKAMAALTAYGERMNAEGASEAQEKIARLTEALNDIIMCDHHNFYDGPPPRFVQIARAALQENANG